MSDELKTTPREEEAAESQAPAQEAQEETNSTPQADAQTADAQTTEAQTTEAEPEADTGQETAAEAVASEATTPETAAVDEATTEAAVDPLKSNGAAAQTATTDRPAPTVSLRDRSEDDDYDSDEDDDFDSDDDSLDDGEDEDDSHYVAGPAEYIQREKGGRARRIGSDIRVPDIDYKNIPMLSRFLDRRGRILSRRKTKVSAKVQRAIVKAIKRARHLALLPYTGDHTRVVQKRGR